MTRILCVHQGFELYGSDRWFIESIRWMRDALPDAQIDAIVPRDGPIVEHLRGVASNVTIQKLWVLRRRYLPRLLTRGLLELAPALWRAMRHCSSYDLIYVNTTVVFDYLMVARLFPGRVLVHVHEIPQGLALRFIRAVLAWSKAPLIFNSQATRSAFAFPRNRQQFVVYNSVAEPVNASPHVYDGTRPFRLLLIGRINRAKGQDVFIEALAKLPIEVLSRIRVRIVGSSFDNQALELALRLSVRDKGLTDIVEFASFVGDPSPMYEWADVVVVPSRLPESLGRVAIEGLAHARPVIVSKIGGLTEVVQDGVSGWHVEPGDASSLAGKLNDILVRPAAWQTFPIAARERYEKVFHANVVSAKFKGIIVERLDQRGLPRFATA